MVSEVKSMNELEQKGRSLLRPVSGIPETLGEYTKTHDSINEVMTQT